MTGRVWLKKHKMFRPYIYLFISCGLLMNIDGDAYKKSRFPFFFADALAIFCCHMVFLFWYNLCPIMGSKKKNGPHASPRRNRWPWLRKIIDQYWWQLWLVESPWSVVIVMVGEPCTIDLFPLAHNFSLASDHCRIRKPMCVFGVCQQSIPINSLVNAEGKWTPEISHRCSF